jgi:hypothetical protein
MPELNQPEFDLECFPLDNPIFGFFPVNEANRRQKMEQENIEFHLVSRLMTNLFFDSIPMSIKTSRIVVSMMNARRDV